MNLTNEVVKDQLKTDLPNFSSGDTIKVDAKIKDGAKFRIQSFEGVVIKRQGSGISQAVLVRKTSNGASVERIFPIHSPLIDKITLIKQGKVRRARIYYMRNRQGKAARIKEIIKQK
ncbi:50S ribosomal protein L19 [Spiroplasma endosymbiont of Anurida maritima]